MSIVNWFDFFLTPRQAAESRMRLMSSSSVVRKARARAEVEFRSMEVRADWHNRPSCPGSDQIVPPHWRAGIQYAREMILAYGTAALDRFEHPNEFESFIRECEWIIVLRTHERKLQPYDQAPLEELSLVQSNFHQLVRAAFSEENAQLLLDAWQRYQDRLDTDASPAAINPSPTNGTGACANTVPADPEVLALDREKRLQEFVAANRTTIAAVSEAAQVHKPDMQHWRHGELNGDSVMAQRIENVLAGKTPLKNGEAKPVSAA
jgi:hypothetical protein